ncbi:hypothetical protein ACP70R_034127 [Stipagrostis hirtigluma subsp. patula]
MPPATRRPSVLLLLAVAGLVLAAAAALSRADAARVPVARDREDEAAAVAHPGQGGSATVLGQHAAVEHEQAKEHVGEEAMRVSIKRGGGGGHGGGGGGRGGGRSDGGGARGGFFGLWGGRSKNSAAGGRVGVWKVAVAASALAGAWLL